MTTIKSPRVKSERDVIYDQLRDPERRALQIFFVNSETYMYYGEPNEYEMISYQLLAGFLERNEVATA